MKKWISWLLCLALVAGISSLNTNEMAEAETSVMDTVPETAAAAAHAEGNGGNVTLLAMPFVEPTAAPTVNPSAMPSGEPSAAPSADPSATPSVDPSAMPSVDPSAAPSMGPSVTPAGTMAPVFTGNLTVKSPDVFETVKNASDKTCIITGYKGSNAVTTLYIPDAIDGMTVTKVTGQVFSTCYFLKNVVVCGDVDFEGNAIFHPDSKVEFWGKTAGKAAAYAAAGARVFHPLEGPQTITGKKAANLSQAVVTWSAVNGASSYNLYQKKGKAKAKYTEPVSVTGLTYTAAKLKPGATYTYKVVPVFSASNGETIEGYASPEKAVSLTPAKPKKVKAKGIRGGIQVRWKRNKSVSGYQVFMKVHVKVKGFKTHFGRVKTITKNKITGYRYKMGVRGMKYSFRVRTFKKVKGKRIFSPYVTVSAKSK